MAHCVTYFPHKIIVTNYNILLSKNLLMPRGGFCQAIKIKLIKLLVSAYILFVEQR
jgi:hypothetical protein